MQKQANSTASTLPICRQPFFRAQTVGEVVHGTARPLALFVFAAEVDAQHILGKLVIMPSNAMTHIQKMAPGPPETMAVATPTILPVPMVPASAVHMLWNWLMAISSFAGVRGDVLCW